MPFRILHVVDSLGRAGTELQLVLNIRGLQRQRFENYVCYLHDPNELEPTLRRQGCPVYGLGLSGYYQWVRGTMRLRRLVKSLNIDLIHTNLFEADVIGGLAGRLVKRPVVSTIANVCFEPELLVDNPHMSQIKMVVPRTIRSFVARTCNAHLICVSQSVAQSATRRLGVPPSKTSVIYRSLASHWLEPGEDRSVQRLQRELRLSDSWPVILNVGRLTPQKGQRYLIEAMARVVQRLPRAKLLIAGDGFLRSSLAELRDEMGLKDQVVFLGQRDDIKDILGLSHLFAFPSLFEGCPNALIEAMAMGKPCVASHIGPTGEVIQNQVTGLLVPPQSPNALAEGILRLASGQEAAICMGRRARAVARERFTIGTAIQKLEALYERVLHEYYGPQRSELLSSASQQGAGE